MAKKLKFSYDREGDILDISLGDPVEAVSQEIEDDFFIRISPTSGKVVGFSVLNFEKWFKDKTDTRTVPVAGEFELVKQT